MDTLAEDQKTFEEVLLRLPGSQSVGAVFPGTSAISTQTIPLTLTVSGNGRGKVMSIDESSTPTQLVCEGGICSVNLPKDQEIRLVGSSNKTSSLDKDQIPFWGGACRENLVSQTECELILSKPLTIMTTFSGPTPTRIPLSVFVSGNGEVTVEDDSQKLHCLARNCLANFKPGVKVTLTKQTSIIKADLENPEETPNSVEINEEEGYWGGSCSRSNKDTCHVLISGNTKINLLQSLRSQILQNKPNIQPTTQPKNDTATLTEQVSQHSEKLFFLSTEERRLLLYRLPESDRFVLQTALTQYLIDQWQFCGTRYPRIHAVGLKNEILYNSLTSTISTTTGEGFDYVNIPIEGRDLHPRCINLRVSIVGTPLPSENLQNKSPDFINIEEPTNSNPDRALITLGPSFLKQIESGDQIEIHVSINQKEHIQSQEDRLVNIFTRKFTFTSLQDYRTRTKNTMVAGSDFQAFPLPDDEIEFLFGPLVRKNFFVVRLSVRNQNTDPKLISTGMIIARGRALVQSRTTTNKNSIYTKTLAAATPTIEGDELLSSRPQGPIFSVPISVVPQSATQMYTILDDEEVEQPRPKFLRGLKFVGALGSAAAAAFLGPIPNKAASLFTGVFIPEAELALPDRWTGYERNIVKFAMPNLLKVPSHGVADHKYLFFSKKKITSLISDPTLYNKEILFRKDLNISMPPFIKLYNLTYFPLAGFYDERKAFDDGRSNAHPDLKIVSLEFDNLEIPFEEVFENSEQVLQEKFQDLLSSLDRHIDNLKQIQTSNKLDVGFGYTRLTNFSNHKKSLTDLQKAIGTVPDPEKTQLTQIITEYTNILNTMLPTTALPDYQIDLIKPGNYGLAVLEKDLDALKGLSRRLTNRSDGGSNFENVVNQVERDFSTSKQIFDFYEQVVQTLKLDLGYQATIPSLVKSINKEKEGDLKNIQSGLKKLIQNLNRLREKRRTLSEKFGPAIPIMNSVEWNNIKELNTFLKKKLTVKIEGEGVVTSTNIQKFSCPPEGTKEKICEIRLDQSSSVTLKATGVNFTNWGHASCNNTGTCTLIMSDDHTVTATFGAEPQS